MTNMPHTSIKTLLFLFFIQICWNHPVRITFELPDNDAICFYENLKGSSKYIFSYQVVHGGSFDVDIDIKRPNQEILRSIKRGTEDTEQLDIDQNGTYAFCFSNEFSSISHKLIFFELHLESYESLSEEAGQNIYPSAMTLIESIFDALHRSLNNAESMSIELKNRDYGDFLVAEDLNSAVLIWSLIVTFFVIITTFGQVSILKSFFSDKKIAYSRLNPGFKS